MRIGMIARADHRGLGIQTRDAYQYLRPDVTIVVDPGPRRPVMPFHPEWYPDGHVIEWAPDDSLPGALDLLSTVDVVWSAETFYDWSLPESLEARGVATVLTVNPELYTGEWVSTVWLPTNWLADRFPPGTPIVPTPAPTHRVGPPAPFDPKPRVIHQAATGPIYDRQGTSVMARADRTLRRNGVRVDVQSQHDSVKSGALVDEPWERDAGAWAMVLPRRYGGQSLAATGCLAQGIPVMMPDIPPQKSDWPIVPLPWRRHQDIRLKAGLIPAVSFLPDAVAESVRRFVSDRRRVEYERTRALAWAADNSWDVWLPRWLEHLRDALLR